MTTPIADTPYNRWQLQDDDTLDYGHLSKTGGVPPSNSSDSEGSRPFYLTTAINYTNGPAHMGHAYEGITSDVIARYHRLKGDEAVYFVTGADEHGQKIANTAEALGKEPIEICDLYVTGFQVLNQRMLVTNDDYIRTTSDRHKRNAQQLWNRCSHDIYLDSYSGWYNVREETFVTDNDAALADYKDPASGLPLKQVEEESYFFKMSAYHDRLVAHIEQNPEFIQPEHHRNQILSRLKADELRDLSISRTTFSWGIPVPTGFADNHVMYVWVDALSNYLTGVNALETDPEKADLSKFWPANVHIIGKDILWFHTVIWPCLLMSAGIPLPQTVFAHGFVNDEEGKKMSKSLGNVVDPHDMLDKFTVDTFRWYLCKEAPYGGELSFGEERMREMHNADLADTIGNLIHRATNLCKKYCGGIVPGVAVIETPLDLASLIDNYKTRMNQFELQGGAQIAIQGFRDLNGYLQEAAPWKLKGDEHLPQQQAIVRTCLELIYVLAHLILPFLSTGASQIFSKLNAQPVGLNVLKTDGTNLMVGKAIDVGDVLYAKSLSREEIQDAAAASKSTKETYEEAQKRKKEAKLKAAAASQAGQNQSEFTKMDIRVGKITKVWNHEKAEKLFCEEIDLGSETRQIASGLREHYTLEDMQNRKVLVVCNLKSAKLHDFVSEGMVLAAKSNEKVELISPPADAEVGERVFIEGLSGEPVSSTQVKKRKVWEAVAQGLKTAEAGVATWDGKIIMTKIGACKATSLVGAPIS